MKRQYNISLPLFFNDGKPVPDSSIKYARSILIEKFGGLTQSAPVSGFWGNGRELFEDTLIILSVVVEDTEDNRAWLKLYKLCQQSAFQQLEVWMTSHPVTVE